ncbi:hypothetical protein BDZ97DRAFT_1918161 [Flammula alnicola]|nr:hypothetical protein BDZ97DRAFT_1918161 [Flammula alnicola]
MSSVVPRHVSNDDHPLRLADIASTVYNNKDRPFQYADLAFDELPQSAQKFLTDTTNLFPLSSIQPDLYFPMMLQVRKARQERLVRTLEGVHRSIVAGMLATSTPADNREDRSKHLFDLQSVLIPEWRSHLDAYVDEIDALIWFEMATRKGTRWEQSLEQSLREREEDVQRMLEFALQCLQMINDKESEGHISDRESDVSDSDGQWVPVNGHVGIRGGLN